MVFGHRHNITSAGTLEEGDPLLGVILFGLEERDEVLVPEFVLRAVVFGMPLDALGVLVHMPLVPFAAMSGNGIEAPVNEDPELCLVEPGRHRVGVAQGLPRGLYRTVEIGLWRGISVGCSLWGTGLHGSQGAG